MFLGLNNIIKSPRRVQASVLTGPNLPLFILGCLLIASSIISTAITNMLIGIYTLTWIFLKIFGNIAYPKIDKNLLVSIFLLSATATLSLILNFNSSDSHTSSLHSYLRLLLMPALIPAFVTKYQKRMAIHTFLAAAFVNLIIIYAKISGFLHNDTFSPGATQAFKDSIFTSYAMALSIYFCLHLAAYKDNSRVQIIVYIVILSLFCQYLYFISIGRTGQLLGLLLILTFFIQKLKLRQVFYITPLIAIAFTSILINSSFKDRILVSINEAQIYLSKPKETLSVSNSSLGLRLEWATNAAKLALSKPIFGFGVGSFEKAYQNKFPQRYSQYGEIVNNPHNQYLLTSVDMGLLGLSLYIIFLISIGRVYFTKKNNTQCIALLGLLISFCIGSMANSWLKDHTSSIIFITLTAVFLPIADIKKVNLK